MVPSRLSGASVLAVLAMISHETGICQYGGVGSVVPIASFNAV